MKRINKFLSILLVFVIFVSLFSFSAFADDTVTYRLHDFKRAADSDGVSEFKVVNVNGVDYTSVRYSLSNQMRITAFLNVSNELKAGASYTLTYTVVNNSVSGYITGFIYLSDDTEKFDNAVELGSFTTENLTGKQDYSIQMIYPDNFNGKQCYIVVMFIVVPSKVNNNFVASSPAFLISDFVFTNNDPVTKDGFFDGLLGGISDFFDFLVDMILYFQHPVSLNADGVPINDETGEPIYTNPFSSNLSEILAKLEEWTESINGFIDSMDSARDNITGYMDSGKELIDGVVTGVPILSAVLIFVAGFYVVRKVVGQ